MAEAKEDTQYELDVSDSPETEVEIPEKEVATSTENEVETVVEEAPAVEEDDSEHEEYSASVKKRINRLTKKMREAERQREEAIRYAQTVQTESEQLRNRVQTLDHGYMTEYGNRLNVEQQQAEAEYRKAIEIGDPDATLAAQKRLTDLSVAAQQYQQAAAQQQYYAQQQAAAAQQQPQQAPPVQQAPPQSKPDPKAESWASKNEWFGTDEAMTFAAFGVHKRLVEDEGFDPTSDEYYTELDSRMRSEFPHKLNGNSGSERRPAQTVTGVSRSTTSGRSKNRVKLSPTQVAIAKKLGVPLEEYAKYVKE